MWRYVRWLVFKLSMKRQDKARSRRMFHVHINTTESSTSVISETHTHCVLIHLHFLHVTPSECEYVNPNKLHNHITHPTFLFSFYKSQTNPQPLFGPPHTHTPQPPPQNLTPKISTFSLPYCGWRVPKGSHWSDSCG